MERRSELEMVALGLVWKKGPCTIHSVRMEFAASRSSHWSGSAGSIYPLVRRMERQGLVRSEVDRSTRQRRRLYTITPAGSAALRQWFALPQPGEVFGVQYDPIRIRMYFLGILAVDRQLDFLRAAEAELRARLPELRAERDEYRRDGWIHSSLATDGLLAVCEAQLAWLARARRTLARHPEAKR